MTFFQWNNYRGWKTDESSIMHIEINYFDVIKLDLFNSHKEKHITLSSDFIPIRRIEEAQTLTGTEDERKGWKQEAETL